MAIRSETSKVWTPHISGLPGPIYLVVANAILEDVRLGKLKPGELLPPQRNLATRLGVDPTTITRAYNQAKKSGHLAAKVGFGTYVLAASSGTGSLPVVIDMATNLPPEPAGLAIALRSTFDDLKLRNDLGAMMMTHRYAGTYSDRTAGAAWLAKRIGPVDPSRVILTAGTQAALSLLLERLVPSGGILLTESLTYPAIKGIAARMGINLVGLTMDRHGLIPCAFEAACKKLAPSALYTIPTIHPTTTAIMPIERRHEIARIGRKYGVPIIEDDAYGRFAPESPVPIAQIAPDIVWFIAGVAKGIAPGLRTAFISAPDEKLAQKLVAATRTTTWMVTPLSALIASSWIESGVAEKIEVAMRRETAARQRLAARALQGFNIQSHPNSPHLWLHLPATHPWRDLISKSHATHIKLASTEAFATDNNIPNAIRVCLGGAANHAVLGDGLRELTDMLLSPSEAHQPVLT